MFHTTRTQRFLIFVCGAFTLPLLAIADGQHNDKTCYAETAGGIEISSSCSSRNTTCNDDFTCSIDGVAGEMRDGLEMNKADIISEIAEKTDATDPKVDSVSTSGNRATDYNSSRSNKADGNSKLDSNGDADDADADEGNRATDYNSSRSNKAEGNSKLDSDSDADSSAKTRMKSGASLKIKVEKNKLDKDTGANHNSTRSNKTKPVADDSYDDDSDIDDSDGADEAKDPATGEEPVSVEILQL
jgi:hypothetical protein